ncbi:MAG: HAD-IIB family hydrolase [Candidatus Thermoplasmatota archaeon]|nr:HAD-IIB family hydrolase [Candidatus Thermoplasmatota archaeon]
MKLIFTDLDGTLLDHDDYSFTAAKKGLQLVKKQKIPIIFCTSKTRSELLYWRKLTHNQHPFISENGGGIFIPISYFPFTFKHTKKVDSFFLIRLGAPKNRLTTAMNALEKDFDLTSFQSMDNKTIMNYTNLPFDQAKLASKREFDIPFVLHNETQIEKISNRIYDQDLSLTKGGRFYHLIGNNDKGKAVRILINLFKQIYDLIDSIGIGDSENDFSMLEAVNKPYLVKKPDGTYASNDFLHSDGIGPSGWQKIIEKEFKTS